VEQAQEIKINCLLSRHNDLADLGRSMLRPYAESGRNPPTDGSWFGDF